MNIIEINYEERFHENDTVQFCSFIYNDII